MDLLSILVQNGYDLDFFINFAIFGIATNFVSVLIMTVVLWVRIGELSEEATQEYIRFLLINHGYIVEFNSKARRIARLLLIFIPTYTTCLNIRLLIHMFRNPGLVGLIQNVIHKERYSILPLIKYKLIIAPIGDK